MSELEAATKVLTRAVDLDNNHRYKEALICYQEGTNLLMLALKKETDSSKKAALRQKLDEYLKRGEVIKPLVQNLSEKHHERIEVKDGERGHSYKKIFEKCLFGNLTEVRVEDPYVRTHHQIQNFVRFCELLVHVPTMKKIKLLTVLLSGEATALFNMAQKMNNDGKLGKALKLFQQALKLSPNNPDVLNAYGEFLENEKLIEAENLYTRALINDPSHSQALANRQRTFPKVQKLDQDMLARIDNKRYRLYEIPEENAALQRAMKEAYYQHIHHTTAIEGNTMTLSMARAVVETKMAVHGKSVLEHNEILGLDEALKYINTTLVQEKHSITVNNIMEIHRRVLGHAHPLEAGQFRSTQVFVGNHIPPHPTDVERFMDEFDAWLSSPTIRNLHPIEFAALAHYRLVYIHPFTDGNGRTGRLLMNLILMRAGFPPVTIKVEERHNYYACLQDANQGDVRPFIRFVAKCAERTLDEYLSATTIYPVEQYTSRALDYSNHLRRLDTLTLTK